MGEEGREARRRRRNRKGGKRRKKILLKSDGRNVGAVVIYPGDLLPHVVGTQS